AATVRAAPAQGLPAQDVAADVAAFGSANAAVKSKAEADLAHAAIAYARAERGMDLNPKALDPDFALREPYDAAAEFAKARESGAVAAWLAGLARHDPAYLGLVAARGRYAQIVARGGWPTVRAGPPLTVGAEGDRIAVLRARLAAEGYGPAPARGRARYRFDRRLAAALADFQRHHRISPDGALTAQTVKALDVSAAARLSTIEVNLERARWLAPAPPPTRVEVDIAAPEATFFQNGAPALSMRAIAGDPDHQTPTFASEIDAVEIDPPWIVPKDIAERELFPKERRSRHYFARHDFHVVDGRLIQKAGPMSALGYVKFDMPDAFEVYLHDTPDRADFDRERRWLSHGCVRLQAPRALTTALLASQGWTRQSLDAAIAAGATRTVQLPSPVPVFVVYRTAVAARDGKVDFRKDVYGWDTEIAAALACHPMPAPKRNGET
ncbi:MAG: L,D-transpeptidase family protein, partial [Caulobacteraceae bacterium]